jgi:hypothetical protein
MVGSIFTKIVLYLINEKNYYTINHHDTSFDTQIPTKIRGWFY